MGFREKGQEMQEWDCGLKAGGRCVRARKGRWKEGMRERRGGVEVGKEVNAQAIMKEEV